MREKEETFLTSNFRIIEGWEAEQSATAAAAKAAATAAAIFILRVHSQAHLKSGNPTGTLIVLV